jgi:hypothetical protein
MLSKLSKTHGIFSVDDICLCDILNIFRDNNDNVYIELDDDVVYKTTYEVIYEILGNMEYDLSSSRCGSEIMILSSQTAEIKDFINRKINIANMLNYDIDTDLLEYEFKHDH